jgi:ubiquinone/menaquinone biosynthesis C-methylase UbiE
MSSNNKLPDGAKHELDFWKRFVKTDQFATWLAPGVTPELDIEVVEFMRPLVEAGATVLDVASGVVSILNGFVPNDKLHSTDLLGDEYMRFFDYGKHNCRPPFPVAAEFLHMAKKTQFDITHIRNGLDHCQNVQMAFMQLITMTKPGGHIIIQGFENEATAENWQGFHQTNLRINTTVDAIIAGNKDGEEFVLEHETIETVMVFPKQLHNGKAWFIWIGKKITV